MRSVDAPCTRRRAYSRSTWRAIITHRSSSAPAGQTCRLIRLARIGKSADAEAELLVPLEEPVPVRIGVQLIAIGNGDATAKSVQMRFNDLLLETVTPSGAWQRYWWNIPAEVVRPG